MTEYLHRTVATILLICAVAPLNAQPWKEEIQELILRPQTTRHLSAASEAWTHQESRNAIRFAAGFLGDSAYQVRQRVLEISHALAMRTEDPAVRQFCVHLLLNTLARKDHELTGSAISALTTFRRDDFSTHARDTVMSLIRNRSPQFNQLIKLAGFLKLDDLQADLRNYALAGNSSATRWAAMLALARMGDKNAMEDVLRRVEKVGLTDEAVYNVYPELIYTRHQEAIAYLADLIKVDEKNCFSADAEREQRIPCAYRILEQLTAVIENFPLDLDEGGDLNTKDYPAALALAREWFAKNPTYSIQNDKY